VTKKGDNMVTETDKNESWYDEHCSNYPDETDPDSIRFAYYGREIVSWRKAEKSWEEAFGADDRVP
jgi:hypothetical protein